MAAQRWRREGPEGRKLNDILRRHEELRIDIENTAKSYTDELKEQYSEFDDIPGKNFNSNYKRYVNEFKLSQNAQSRREWS